MVWEGPDAVAQVRKMNGATELPQKADVGTIRGDFGLSMQNNIDSRIGLPWTRPSPRDQVCISKTVNSSAIASLTTRG